MGLRFGRHRRLPDLRHSAYTLAEKEPGWENIFDALLGCQVIQETVPLALDEAFHRRGMGLDAFVRFSSTNPARIAGLHRARARCCPGPTPTLRSMTSTPNGWSTRAASSSPKIPGRRSTAARCGPAWCARWCAVTPCVPLGRSWPSPAPAVSCPATTIIRWRAGSRSPGADRVPAGAPEPEHRRSSHRSHARRGAGGAARRLEVTASTRPGYPASIESEADAVVAAAEVAALVRSLAPHDAYLIACFGRSRAGRRS